MHQVTLIPGDGIGPEVAAAPPELMNQRAKQSIVIGIQPLQQVFAALGADNFLIDADIILFDLLIKFLTVSDDQYTGIGIIGQDPLGKPHHSQALAAALVCHTIPPRCLSTRRCCARLMA